MKRKKKEPTLPWHVTPYIPDKAKSAEKFNELNTTNAEVNSSEEGISEAMNTSSVEKLKKDIVNYTISYMKKLGFDEDDALAYSQFYMEDEGDRYRVTVQCELGFDEMFSLAERLNPLVSRYDRDAYFDMEQPGIISAFIYKNSPVQESLKRLDKQLLEHSSVYSDLYGLYESTNNKLSEQDKAKLAEFVKKTDDVQEVETFIQGLLNKKNESLKEEIEDIDLQIKLDNDAKKYNKNIYNELPEWCKLYIDEFDAPWIRYGRLPDGTVYYIDAYDEFAFPNLDTFIDDQRYNFEQLKAQYDKNPEAFDFSKEFNTLINASNWKDIINED